MSREKGLKTLLCLFLVLTLFACQKQEEGKPEETETSTTGEMMKIRFVNEVEDTDLWILPQTEKNLKTSLWGTATVAMLKKEDAIEVAIEETSDHLYILRLIDQRGALYTANDFELHDGDTIVFDAIDDDFVRARLTLLDKDGNVLAQKHENYTSMNGLDLLAYGAQENEYYDAACFKAEAMRPQSEEVLLEGRSEEIIIRDFFPEEKVIDLKDKTLTSFSYSARKAGMTYGTYFGELQGFDLYVKDDAASCYGSYVKNGKLKEFEKILSKEQFEKLCALIKEGRLERRSLRDPELIVMDEDIPERIRAGFEDMEKMLSQWYEFIPADKEALLNLLLEIAK